MLPRRLESKKTFAIVDLTETLEIENEVNTKEEQEAIQEEDEEDISDERDEETSTTEVEDDDDFGEAAEAGFVTISPRRRNAGRNIDSSDSPASSGKNSFLGKFIKITSNISNTIAANIPGSPSSPTHAPSSPVSSSVISNSSASSPPVSSVPPNASISSNSGSALSAPMQRSTWDSDLSDSTVARRQKRRAQVIGIGKPGEIEAELQAQAEEEKKRATTDSS